jgi:hypothetical protein
LIHDYLCGVENDWSLGYGLEQRQSASDEAMK